MKRQNLYSLMLLIAALFTLAATGFAQCSDSTACTGSEVTFYVPSIINSGNVDSAEVTVSGVTTTQEVTSVNFATTPYSITTKLGAYSCSDTATKIKWRYGTSSVGYTCNDNISLPVEMISYQADEYTLKWSTASERNSLSFEVLNLNTNLIVGIIPAAGNSNEILNYEYEVEQPGKYLLVQYDLDGKKEMFGPVRVGFNLTLDDPGETVYYDLKGLIVKDPRPGNLYVAVNGNSRKLTAINH